MPSIDRSGRPRAGLVGGRSLLRLYRSVDIAVDLVGPNPFQHPIPVQGSRNRWLNPGKPEGEPGLLNKTGDFRHFGRTLRVDEVDALAVEHDPTKSARLADDVTDPV